MKESVQGILIILAIAFFIGMYLYSTGELVGTLIWWTIVATFYLVSKFKK